MRMKRYICGGVLCAVAVVICVFMANTCAMAVSPNELLEQIESLQQEQGLLEEQIQTLETQRSDNLAGIEDALMQKSKIEQQIFLLQKQISLSDTQIQTVSRLIADKQEELEEAQEKYDLLYASYKNRILAMEENGELTYWLVLFRASSFSDLLDRFVLIEEIAASDNRRLEGLKTAAEEIQEIQDTLLDDRAVLERLRQSQIMQRQQLEEKRMEKESVLQEIIVQDKEYITMLGESENHQQSLMEELAKLEAVYDDAIYRQCIATAETTQEEISAEEVQPVDSENWLTPVPYYTLTSPFGMRMHPLLNVWRMHNGVDLACAENTPIFATKGGVVTVADYQENGAGNYIQINHGSGYSSVYMHMSYYVVSAGQWVDAGEIIGYVGSTGLSSGEHLHFGIAIEGSYQNPMEYIA